MLAGEQGNNGSAKADAAIVGRSQQTADSGPTDNQAVATAAQEQHDSTQHRPVLHSAQAVNRVHDKPIGSSDSCGEAADAGLKEGRATSAGSRKTAWPKDGNKPGQSTHAGAVAMADSTAC